MTFTNTISTTFFNTSKIQQNRKKLKNLLKDNEYIIQGRLAEKDKQIEDLTKKQEDMEKKFQMIFVSSTLTQNFGNPKK
jgi:peptidoglycan hydrolase CwlO-like protein